MKARLWLAAAAIGSLTACEDPDGVEHACQPYHGMNSKDVFYFVHHSEPRACPVDIPYPQAAVSTWAIVEELVFPGEQPQTWYAEVAVFNAPANQLVGWNAAGFGWDAGYGWSVMTGTWYPAATGGALRDNVNWYHTYLDGTGPDPGWGMVITYFIGGIPANPGPDEESGL